MMSLLSPPRECDPPKPPDGHPQPFIWLADHMECWTFQWLGQSFEACENCGDPESLHMYHPPYGQQRVLFRVKQYNPRLKRWTWQPVGSIIGENNGEVQN